MGKVISLKAKRWERDTAASRTHWDRVIDAMLKSFRPVKTALRLIRGGKR